MHDVICEYNAWMSEGWEHLKAVKPPMRRGHRLPGPRAMPQPIVRCAERFRRPLLPLLIRRS